MSAPCMCFMIKNWKNLWLRKTIFGFKKLYLFPLGLFERLYEKQPVLQNIQIFKTWNSLIFHLWGFILKVWWHQPLFLFIFYIFSYNTFIHSFIHSPRVHSCLVILVNQPSQYKIIIRIFSLTKTLADFFNYSSL